jgi:carboxypeptidase C (cathepsin A)
MLRLNILSIFLLFSITVATQEKNQDSTSVPKPKSFITTHQITNGGEVIKYKAIASETYLKNTSDEPVASIWSVAYVQEGIDNQTKRPVTFVFN